MTSPAVVLAGVALAAIVVSAGQLGPGPADTTPSGMPPAAAPAVAAGSEVTGSDVEGAVGSVVDARHLAARTEGAVGVQATVGGGAGGASARRARWSWPLSPRPDVVRPFVRPVGDYGAGHRGLDLRGGQGDVVMAVADGVVTHAGVVAGRPTITVTHADGLRSTYEPVRSVIKAGHSVTRGEAIGELVTQGGHCGEDACLHLGALRGRDYLDPLPLLTGAGRVILLPLGIP